MQLRENSFLIIVITLILTVPLGIVPKFNDSAQSHGPLMGKGYQEEVLHGTNGGIVLKLEKNYIEFVVDHESGEISLIMLDKKMNPIPMPEDITGRGYLRMIRMTSNSIKWFDLELGYRDKTPYLYAKTGIENIGPFNAVIQLNINDERKNFRFSWSDEEQ